MMKKAGLLLITIAFLIGAYLTSLDPEVVMWQYFIPVLILGFAGVIIIKISGKKDTHTEERFTKNLSDIESSLSNIIQKLNQLNSQKDEINTYDMRHKIDELLIDDLNTFVEARETIGHAFSLQAYADIMSNFAGGERYLNRTWSASADGYIEEVSKSLKNALDQFNEAKVKLDAVKISENSLL
jgi:hypothetical protein